MQTVTKRDIVWFLGDIILHPDGINKIKYLPGDKRLILGNHDTDRFAKKISLEDLRSVFTQIHGIVKYKWAWLTHAPIHPDELRGRIGIHGHCHKHVIDDSRYVNVCLEHTEFKPIKYQDIIANNEYLKKRKEEKQ